MLHFSATAHDNSYCIERDVTDSLFRRNNGSSCWLGVSVDVASVAAVTAAVVVSV